MFYALYIFSLLYILLGPHNLTSFTFPLYIICYIYICMLLIVALRVALQVPNSGSSMVLAQLDQIAPHRIGAESATSQIGEDGGIHVLDLLIKYSRPREGGSPRRRFPLRGGSVPKSWKYENCNVELCKMECCKFEKLPCKLNLYLSFFDFWYFEFLEPWTMTFGQIGLFTN